MSDQSSEVSRRVFLRATGCAAAALCAALPAELSALPIAWISSEASGAQHSYPVPAADSVNVDRAAQVILVRYQNHAFAFALSCPHQNAALKWVEKDKRFQCTKHDSKYQPDGVYTSGRATRNMDRFAIRRDGANLLVDLSRVFQSDADAAGWSAAAVVL